MKLTDSGFAMSGRFITTIRRKGPDRAQLVQRAKSFGSEDLERIAREVSEPTRFILHRLLRHEPGERYRSAAELERALRERLQALGPYDAKEAAEEVFVLQCVGAGVPREEIPPPNEPTHQEPITERDEDKIPTDPALR